MAKNTQVALGQAVTYVSSKGYEKMALVIGTPQSVQPGHGVPELPEGALHLLVVSPSGTIYPRFSVPSAEAAKEIPDFAVDGEDLKGIWK